MGETEAVIEVLKKANGLIDPEREPRLLLCVHHNLVYSLTTIGLHQEAAALLPELKALAELHGSAMDRLRLDWVEGRVASGLGDHAHAQTLLTRVRRAFLGDGNIYEAALVTLDLAISSLEEGRSAEVCELAEEMVSVFRAHDVDREALAAVLLLEESARRETATAELAHQVAAALCRTRT